jgi:hypothetical protein
MADTAIVGENVEILQTAGSVGGKSPLSWSAAIAGAIAATAVTFIVISLGTGIGLSLASPYRPSPSAGTLTIAGAVWLVMAQAIGFTTGGYFAGRLRSPAGDGVIGERRFRDGAQGFLVWALGVVITLFMIMAAGELTALVGVNAAATTAGATAGSGAGNALQRAGTGADPTGYYVDTLFRAPPSAAASPSPAAAGDAQAAEQSRGEASRILTTGIRDGQLSQEDRTQLARIVSARTGMSPEEANRRVDEVVAQYRENAKAAADKAAKAGAYLSFWTFMSLLIGAAAGTLGGIVGGELRDEHALLTD